MRDTCAHSCRHTRVQNTHTNAFKEKVTQTHQIRSKRIYQANHTQRHSNSHRKRIKTNRHTNAFKHTNTHQTDLNKRIQPVTKKRIQTHTKHTPHNRPNHIRTDRQLTYSTTHIYYPPIHMRLSSHTDPPEHSPLPSPQNNTLTPTRLPLSTPVHCKTDQRVL